MIKKALQNLLIYTCLCSISIEIPLCWSCAFLNNVRSGTYVVRATSAYDSPLRTLLRALDDVLLLVLPATHHHLLYSSLFVFKGRY